MSDFSTKQVYPDPIQVFHGIKIAASKNGDVMSQLVLNFTA